MANGKNMKDQNIFLKRDGLILKSVSLFMFSVNVMQKLKMKDHAKRISDINQMSQYILKSMQTPKRLLIVAKAHEIHHRIMLHTIHQRIIDIIKLVRENRIFDSFFLCSSAIISGIQSKASGKTCV